MSVPDLKILRATFAADTEVWLLGSYALA